MQAKSATAETETQRNKNMMSAPKSRSYTIKPLLQLRAPIGGQGATGTKRRALINKTKRTAKCAGCVASELSRVRSCLACGPAGGAQPGTRRDEVEGEPFMGKAAANVGGDPRRGRAYRPSLGYGVRARP